MKKIVLAVVAICFLIGMVGVWQATSFLYGSKSAQEERYELKRGVSFSQVAKELQSREVITSSQYFYFLARALRKTTKVRVGDYLIPAGSSPREVLDILVLGKSVEFAITIQEGLNMYEIADLLEARGIASREEFLKVCRDKNLIRSLLAENVDSLEGYLFPETYKLTRLTSVKELIKNMVRSFLAVYRELQSEFPAKIRRHELVTLASIVEKETGSSKDRGKIASVFHNRLIKRMRLQSDPTILYGILDKTGIFKKNITRKDIKKYTRYNTYRVNRLPYGPISNPGRAALVATLRPERTKFLYFVSRNDGTTQFSETLREHNRAVYRFQILKKGREGKSWRDLKKRK
ncbi:endolytic transglycosylase MltG [Bdellovibrionales bacterium]|nr:endolytic transglycosylase MltG [Bdellovibrionales bacterium]